MAATRLLTLQSVLPLLQPIQFARQPLLSSPIVRRILSPSIPASPLSIPLAAFAGVSDLLREIWEGILRAVPKKKTSHMKKRHRQMAGKALKDVTNFVKCSACGKMKRSHILCPYCVEAVRTYVKKNVLGIADHVLQGPKSRGQNIAETAPDAWRRIKEARERKAQKIAKEQLTDKTKW